MRFTITLFAATLHAMAFAQVIIDQDDMPVAGESMFRCRAAITPGLDYTTTGPSTTWDMSGINVLFDDTIAPVTVASTGQAYAVVFVDLPFNPNRSNLAFPGSLIPLEQFLPIGASYTFAMRTGSQYRVTGFGAEINGAPLPIVFDQPDVIYELPLQAGDQGTSNSSYSISIPGQAYYAYEQTRTNVVDGWGVITTPMGSFDALRVLTTIAVNDSIYLDSLGQGIALQRPIVREYKWLSPGIRIPVLQVNTVQNFGFEQVSEVWLWTVERSITLVPPPPADLCPGSVLDLTYEAAGIYNTGSFQVPANEFAVELSDANGSFANADTLGSAISTVSGAVSIALPAGLQPGGGYLLRLVATSPATIGSSYPLTIGDVPATPVITESGGILSVSGTGTYQWILDGDPIPGATGATFVPVTAGSYTVVVTNAQGCTATSASYDVLATSLPQWAMEAPSVTPSAGAGPHAVRVDARMLPCALVVVDAAGHSVLQRTITDERSLLDLSTCTAGRYQLLFRAKGHQWSIPVIHH
jgi:hypothetical protein